MYNYPCGGDGLITHVLQLWVCVVIITGMKMSTRDSIFTLNELCQLMQQHHTILLAISQYISTEEQHQRVARVFLTIVEGVASVDDFFLQKADALGKTGATTLQRVTVVVRMLAYGVSAD